MADLRRVYSGIGEAWESFVLSLPAPDLMPETHRRYHAHLARIAARRKAEELQRLMYAKSLEAARQAHDLALGRPKTYLHPANKIRYSLQDRWAGIGATGSGKTVWAEQLVGTLARMFPQAGVNVLDSKWDSSFNGDPDLILTAEPPAPAAPGERLVWRPPTNDRDAYDAWCESLLRSDWPAVVQIDELASLGGTTGGASFPLNYHLLLKQGRDREKCLVTLTQEAAWIPRDTIGQTTHLIRMRLILESDALKCDRLVHGDKLRHEPVHPYGFWYKCLARPSAPTYFREWREMLGLPSAPRLSA